MRKPGNGSCIFGLERFSNHLRESRPTKAFPRTAAATVGVTDVSSGDHSAVSTERGAPEPRRVRVPNRDDVGVVVVPGKNFGMSQAIYCLGIHFPETGECLYYDARRVRDADE